jgi:hypothetical protein
VKHPEELAFLSASEVFMTDPGYPQLISAFEFVGYIKKNARLNDSATEFFRAFM